MSGAPSKIAEYGSRTRHEDLPDAVSEHCTGGLNIQHSASDLDLRL